MKKLFLLLLAVTVPVMGKPVRIVSLTVEDHHGFHETVTSKDRLGPYQKVNWLQSQPYRKVVRTYDSGRTFMTTYYESGQIKQYLQIVDSRAHGKYLEWHPNGQRKVEAQVIGGIADLEDGAVASYIFHGMAFVWNDAGQPVAEIPYSNGEIDGVALHYGEGGTLETRAAFAMGRQQGAYHAFYPNGTIKETATYNRGQRDGAVARYAHDGTLLAQEEYKKGRLVYGAYNDRQGISEGCGVQVVDVPEGGYQEVEHQDGCPCGAVRHFDDRGALRRVVHVVNEQKCGEETIYYPPPYFGPLPEVPTPKLQFTWHEDQLQGPVFSWYPSGVLETQREMSGNEKNGLSTAWYEDGSLMLIEEYRDDQLIKGEYYSLGSAIPESRVTGGTGTATLFDGGGRVTARIAYLDGTPVR